LSSPAGLGMTVESPCRADLAGGTLDIWPLGMLHPGSVTVNAAIPVMVRLEVDLEAPPDEVWHAIGDAEWRRLGEADATSDLSAAVAFAVRPTGGVRVRVRSQAALGSGLGGSSAYAVALARGILTATGGVMADERLVAVARDLEARILGISTGVQDHWASVCGGVLAVHHEPGGERVEALDVDSGWVGERMTIFDTGISHHSGMVNWQVIRRRLDGEAVAVDAFEAIAQAARSCRDELIAGNEDGVGQAVADEWRARKRLAPEVCPSELDLVVDAGLAAGRPVAPVVGGVCWCGTLRGRGTQSSPPSSRPRRRAESSPPGWRRSAAVFYPFSYSGMRRF